MVYTLYVCVSVMLLLYIISCKTTQVLFFHFNLRYLSN